MTPQPTSTVRNRGSVACCGKDMRSGLDGARVETRERLHQINVGDRRSRAGASGSVFLPVLSAGQPGSVRCAAASTSNSAAASTSNSKDRIRSRKVRSPHSRRSIRCDDQHGVAATGELRMALDAVRRVRVPYGAGASASGCGAGLAAGSASCCGELKRSPSCAPIRLRCASRNFHWWA